MATRVQQDRLGRVAGAVKVQPRLRAIRNVARDVFESGGRVDRTGRVAQRFQLLDHRALLVVEARVEAMRSELLPAPLFGALGGGDPRQQQYGKRHQPGQRR